MENGRGSILCITLHIEKKATGEIYTIETVDYNDYFSEDVELLSYEYIKPPIVLTGYELFELIGEYYERI